MSIESVKCLDEGVLRAVPDANIGLIFGIGLTPNQGGATAENLTTRSISTYALSNFPPA